MNIINLKKASNYSVEVWLEKSIPELTKYQKEKIREDEIVRFSPFYFYERDSKTHPKFLMRLTLPFFILCYILAIILIPLNFMVSGTWRYSEKSVVLKVLSPWARKLNFAL